MASTFQRHGAALLAALLLVVARAGSDAGGGDGPLFEFVETWPVGTTLDHPDLRDAHEVWVEMISGAKRTIDLAHYYASNRAGSRLEPVVRALEAAADRGVRVRFLADAGFHRTYPATLDRLDRRAGIEVRLFDVRGVMGGVLHAKYFLVDDEEVFLGSQNFDWRALEHIQELGVRLRSSELAQAFGEVFEADWRLAAGEAAILPLGGDPSRFPIATADGVGLTPVFSPTGFLPDESLWDLPRLVALIDGAEESVRVQLLSYATTDRHGVYFDDLESALRRAAARGVRIQLLLADWSKRRWTIEGLQSLQCVPRITVKLVTIPESSDGFIPFARVVHAKYLVVDGERAWIGTSNWSRDYFHASRNVGLLLEGAGGAAPLERFFSTGWGSPYAEVVDPGATYEPPRIGE